jgi:hypothetical protein
MDGLAVQQQLRNRLLERDKEIHILRSAKLDLEDSLSDALRKAKAAEATNRRLAEELTAVKWSMQHRQTDAAGPSQEKTHYHHPIDATVNAQLVVDLQDVTLQAHHWKVTAQLVLQSYRERLLLMHEEQTACDVLWGLQVQAATRWAVGCEQRRLSAERSLSAVSKISEVDEGRRLEQFKELADLREQMVLLEGEKLQVDRRCVSQDEAIYALENRVRALSSENRELDFERGVLLERVDRLSAAVLDHASLRDHELRTELMSHSQLRAELSRALQELAICRAEKAELKERLRHTMRTIASSALSPTPGKNPPAGTPGRTRRRSDGPGESFSSPRSGAADPPLLAAARLGADEGEQPVRSRMSLRRVMEVRRPQLFTDATADLFPGFAAGAAHVFSPPGGATGRTRKASRSPRSASRPFR